MARIITAREAAELIPHGASVMIGGFIGCGTPLHIIDALVETDNGDFTVICNDAGRPDFASGRLLSAGKIKHLIASHVGTNPMAAEKYTKGELELTLVPQGSFAEMIRAGGAGLGGIVTPTGVSTEVENYWYVDRVLEIDGKKYLLKKPLKADFALIGGTVCDTLGNVWFKGTTKNFNVAMAAAAKTVIVGCEKIVEPGEIEPENIHIPFNFTNYIVCGGGLNG
ncbi:MAG: CoA transferase subunit A [Ruminococcaceae bacterium]|nr:CoA transferase subunit A [Oscillospiraceae bacterium]